MAYQNGIAQYSPLPGRYGTMRVLVTKALGTITANTTTTFTIGAPVGDSRRAERSKLLGVSVVAQVKPADADGTILANAVKRDSSAGADVAVSSASLDLEALTNQVVSEFSLVSDQDKLQFDTGDYLEIDVVNNSAAIDTQATDMVVVAEFALIH